MDAVHLLEQVRLQFQHFDLISIQLKENLMKTTFKQNPINWLKIIKYLNHLPVFIGFFCFLNIGFAQTEVSAILNSTHKASWVYYTDSANARWYISPLVTSKKQSVYSLGPISNGKASWWTVGNDVASIDITDKTLTIDDNLDSSSSDAFIDIASNTQITNSSIHSDRQRIQGSTTSMKWYFFQAQNNRWYIVNDLSYGNKLTVLLFASKNNQYDWQEVDTSNLTMDMSGTNINFTLDLSSAPNGRDVRIENVPFQSQLSASCKPNYLCGFASTVMITSFYNKVEPSTSVMQNMAMYTKGKHCPTNLSTNVDFEKAARSIGQVWTTTKTTLTWDELKQKINEGSPVLVNLIYGNLGNYRCSTSWSGGHSIVVVGYSEPRGEWLIHDPLCSTPTNGTYRAIPSKRFRDAVGNAFIPSRSDKIDALILN